MSQVVVETHNLCKQYASQMALDHCSLRLEQGKIYGLIGKNGAGKTTFMRLVSGLDFPTKGSISLFDSRNEKELAYAKRRVGSLIEMPGLLNGMTARENMHYQCLMRGITETGEEDTLLKKVGLEDTGKKKVKNFSLGMRQRLGIAVTLLGNPEFLMLDEPINGLDPEGVIEIRRLLKHLQEREQKTILISSHNLPELHQVATDYIILHEGVVRQTISHERLEEQCRCYIALESTNVNQLASVLEDKLHTSDFVVMPDHSVRLYAYLDDRKHLGQCLYDNHIVVTRMEICEHTLEEYVMQTIGGKENA